MRYAYVKDGQIVEGPKGLPKSWGNTSGFHLQTDEELRAIGWLPWRVVEVESPGNGWVLAEPTIEITTTEIVEIQTYRQKSQDEINQEHIEFTENNKSLRLQAYREESDPLFFKSQRGEATKEEWLAKVEEIRSRYSI